MMNMQIRRDILPIVVLFVGGIILLSGAQFLTSASAAGCPDISPLACTAVKLLPDKTFGFDGADGGLTDKNGVGLGFTMVDPPSNPGNPSPDPDAPGYWPEKLEVVGSTLVISTTAGLMSSAANSQDNALGIGLDLGEPAVLETTLVNLPAGPGGFAQAGLWFGRSGIGPSGLGGTGSAQDDYLKLVAISDSPGLWNVQALVEQGGVSVNSTRDPISNTEPLTVRIEINPSLRIVIVRYCNTAGCDASQAPVFQSYSDLPSDWFSADAAGIDLNVGTRSMGGIFASHRNAGQAQLFTFTDFNYQSGVGIIPVTSSDGVDFNTWRFSVPGKPTSLEWGPDGRLYMLDVTGNIYAFTLDPINQTIQATETITSIQPRLALGLTIDPDSTPSNVILWVSHSDLDQANGAANSGVVSRLSGAGFTNRQDVITGLPRAIANHATNSIHFGLDGRLYVAQGGNTGAGSSNDGGSEFGPRPEQPLSAAILVADVKAPGFDGSCTSLIDPTGSIMDSTGIAARDVPCDVQVYASGLRNPYDFTFHSNGDLYATENGLGVVGTFPDLQPDDLSWVPGSSCEGMIQGSTAIANHFPGDRPDLLQRIQPGGYYGHPNPSRDQCVFFGGNPTSNPDYSVPTTSEQGFPSFMDTDKYSVGREPQPGWIPPMFSFGNNKSANGIIEYSPASNAFCGRLGGDLLVTYFSQSDQIRRLILSPDGLAVISDKPLIRSSAQVGGATLSNPLPITQDQDGRIYVGEFGISQITVYDPKNIGVWTSSGLPDLPVALLDAGSTVVDGKLYAVAGKTSTGHQRSLYVFDPIQNAWDLRANLPQEYPEVENPAVTNTGGMLYVFGGSTAAFSGATNKAAVYNPATDTWTMLPDMPTARGGATAQAINNKVYVAGGLGASGDSLTVLEVYDVAANTWSPGPGMITPRDNPGSAAINGKMYLFGGRNITNGSVVDGTLNSVEYLDPGVGWSSGAIMPTGRRTMAVAVYNGEAIVMGGEKMPDGSTFVANEGYDAANARWRLLTNMPVGRHGAIVGTIGNVIYVAGGGTVGGTSFSRSMEAFTFDCGASIGGDSYLYLPIVAQP